MPQNLLTLDTSHSLLDTCLINPWQNLKHKLLQAASKRLADPRKPSKEEGEIEGMTLEEFKRQLAEVDKQVRPFPATAQVPFSFPS